METKNQQNGIHFMCLLGFWSNQVDKKLPNSHLNQSSITEKKEKDRYIQVNAQFSNL